MSSARRVVACVTDVEPPGTSLDRRLWMRLEDGELLTARMLPTAAVRAGDTVVGIVVPYEEGMPNELAILVTRIMRPQTS